MSDDHESFLGAVSYHAATLDPQHLSEVAWAFATASVGVDDDSLLNVIAIEEGSSPHGEAQESFSCNQAESSGFTWELPDISRCFEASDVEVEEDEEDSDEESEAECEEQYEEESDEEELSFIDDFRVTFPKSGSEARSFPSRVHRMKELPAIEEIFGSNPPRLSCSQSQSSLSSSSTNVPSPRDEEHDVMNA
mmetsp:Transcript_21302/g.37130  ORF Transcript_21302/g.37130 Transcript_21302/m.37130 type:complete len:193 (-) Transcript_21302:126-704(-)